jgi:hypothetical protein
MSRRNWEFLQCFTRKRVLRANHRCWESATAETTSPASEIWRGLLFALGYNLSMSDRREPRQLTDNSYPEATSPWPVVRGVLVLAVAIAGVLYLLFADLDFLRGPFGHAVTATADVLFFGFVICEVIIWAWDAIRRIINKDER